MKRFLLIAALELLCVTEIRCGSDASEHYNSCTHCNPALCKRLCENAGFQVRSWNGQHPYQSRPNAGCTCTSTTGPTP